MPKDINKLFLGDEPNKNVELLLGERHELDDAIDDNPQSEQFELADPTVSKALAPKRVNLDQAYSTWAADRNPANMRMFLDAARPSIENAVRHYTGNTDGNAISYARRLVAESMDRYDAQKGASVKTYIHRQLNPLVRWNAKRTAGGHIPDRMLAANQEITLATKELSQELGREPSIDELADRVGLSPKQIVKIQKGAPSMLTGGMRIGEEDGDAVTPEDLAIQRDNSLVWANYVRDTLTEVDKVILDGTLGINGSKPLSNQELARRLKISPAAVSQRKAKIQSSLDRGSHISPFS